MIKRTIVISNPATLSYLHKQLIIKNDDGEHKIPIEDIALVIIDHCSVSYSHYLLSEFAEYNVVVVVCNKKHMPCSLLLALDSHSTHSKVVNMQAKMGKATAKSLWQQIIIAKIKAQARVLNSLNIEHTLLKRLATKVKSGDPDNCEAQAARLYWKQLFGHEFRRDRELEGINSLLNYGYIVLRSAIARAIVTTGLHPALGIFHKNQYNNFCLADDLVEPLRPLVDIKVAEMQSKKDIALSKENKQELIRLLEFNLQLDDKSFPFYVAIDLYIASVKQYVCKEAKNIKIPAI